MIERRSVSIVIPNWNGKALLGRCLPTVKKAIRAHGAENDEIILVDDGSSDGSLAFVHRYFPEINLLKRYEHSGFIKACETGMEASKNNLVMLLNNDMRVSRDFLKPLIRHFNDDDIFAVSPQILIGGAAASNEGPNFACFRFGRVSIEWPYKDTKLQRGDRKPRPILYACGGAALYDKRKFFELGGFDRLYEPFYLEDVDISYRAWKRGWRILYEPKSIVYHEHQGTIGKILTEPEIRFIKERNHLFFTWKNISDKKLLLQTTAYLPARMARALAKGDTTYLKAVAAASRNIGGVLAARKNESVNHRKTDKEVLDISSGEWREE